MKTTDLVYHDDKTTCRGFVAYDDSQKGKRPVVLVAPAFEGCNELAKEYARKIAKLGYAGFAIDMYGDGKVGTSFEECAGYYMSFANDRAMLRRRVLAAYEAVSEIEVADKHNIAGIGFCFGGMCLLDLIRAGAKVKGIVAAHSIWAKPEGIPNEKIHAKVLACHGYKDPQVPPDQLAPFAEEMDAAGVDWQVLYFGNAKHAFTDPEASKFGPPEMGRVYDKLASERTWYAAKGFFAEIF